jgi:TRAP-type C4-dicarboxylate transport system substrate-binding protein
MPRNKYSCVAKISQFANPPMKRLSHFILLFALAIMACANSYYGYSKEEWDKLSPEQQQAAKQEYEEILKKKKDLEHDQLLRERDEQIIRRGLGEPY